MFRILTGIGTLHFTRKMTVRFYELDRFGVINNAVYKNYIEADATYFWRQTVPDCRIW